MYVHLIAIHLEEKIIQKVLIIICCLVFIASYMWRHCTTDNPSSKALHCYNQWNHFIGNFIFALNSSFVVLRLDRPVLDSVSSLYSIVEERTLALITN